MSSTTNRAFNLSEEPFSPDGLYPEIRQEIGRMSARISAAIPPWKSFTVDPIGDCRRTMATVFEPIEIMKLMSVVPAAHPLFAATGVAALMTMAIESITPVYAKLDLDVPPFQSIPGGVHKRPDGTRLIGYDVRHKLMAGAQFHAQLDEIEDDDVHDLKTSCGAFLDHSLSGVDGEWGNLTVGAVVHFRFNFDDITQPDLWFSGCGAD